jgi:hypothetical protein
LVGDDKGAEESDCFIALAGYDDADQSPFGKKGRPAVQCSDCDPACDLDEVAEPNGSCTFGATVCVNLPAIEGCVPTELKKVKVGPKKLGLAAPVPTGASSVCGAFTTFAVKTKKGGWWQIGRAGPSAIAEDHPWT